ncbi:hypothetical protein TNCV_2420161 [Trichonephila clavipes]|nr:hypothetical protein TNCV_2420161 [Trichonephila clavipes]
MLINLIKSEDRTLSRPKMLSTQCCSFQSGIFGALSPDFEQILVQIGIHQIGSLARQVQDMGPWQMEGFRHAPQNARDNSLKSQMGIVMVRFNLLRKDAHPEGRELPVHDT